MTANLALLSVFILICLAGCSGDSEPDIRAEFIKYREFRNARDFDGAMSCFGKNCVFTFQGVEGERTLEDARRMMGWDFAMNPKSEYRDVKVSGDTLTAIIREHNDFYDALGIPYREYKITYVYNDEGKIISHHLEPLPYEGPTTGEAMAPFIAWAKSNHPEALAQIYPDDRILFTAESAEEWKRLLALWHAAVQSPPAADSAGL